MGLTSGKFSAFSLAGSIAVCAAASTLPSNSDLGLSVKIGHAQSPRISGMSPGGSECEGSDYVRKKVSNNQ
ncbi:hypothetical protein CEXT_632791 [Caerostris extrusa]|uniref:Uncharacterized protein n=1 Tax=Caerostris extrusa TaxID=172846 RepID=A0AAV4MFD1_CAEEX|nr:hypothetical protein CEXT_632791 [Caerostris extrusa]